jgi:hypothetical protein
MRGYNTPVTNRVKGFDARLLWSSKQWSNEKIKQNLMYTGK